SMLGLRLPHLLQASAPGTAGRSGRASDKSCLFIYFCGGPSHIDMFDLKPAAPDEIRGPYKPIATPGPGMEVSELLLRLAHQAMHYCLVRSMITRGDSTHQPAIRMLLSGQVKPSERTPFFGSVLAKLRPAARNVPSYVWLQDIYEGENVPFRTGGFLGPSYSPLRIGTTNDNASLANFRVKAFDVSPDVPQ